MKRFFFSLVLLSVVSLGSRFILPKASELNQVVKCGWLQNKIDFKNAGRIESIASVPVVEQWLRLFVGHISLPQIVVIASPSNNGNITPVSRTAALVSNASEWNTVPINKPAWFENVDNPLLVQAVRPLPIINGFVFPMGNEARKEYLRLAFKWPLALPDDYITFQTWVFLDEAANGKHNAIISHSDVPFYYPNSKKKGWHVYIDDGSGTDLRVYFASGDGKDSVTLVSPQPIVPKRWVHIAVTIDRLRNELILYVDGLRVGNTALRLDTDGINGFALGTFYAGGGAHALRGKLAWTSFFSPPLSDAEIVRFYELQYSRLLCAEVAESH